MTPKKPTAAQDLTAELMADLALPEPAAPALALPPELAEQQTPTLSFAVTPMRWSRLAVGPAEQGRGRALRLGPLTWEVSVRDSGGSDGPHVEA